MDEKKLLRRRSKALRDNNEAALVGVCTDLAELYVEQSRYDFAIEEYTTVANIYKNENKLLEYATANRGIGEAYLGLQKFEKAIHHQKIYLDIARQLKNKLEEQRALATIGHTCLSSYLDLSNPDKSNLNLAKKFFKKSLVVSQSLNGQVDKLQIADMSARLFANLGLVEDSLGNSDKAVELITKSINLCKANDLYEQLQRGYISLASLMIKQDNSKSALQQYNLAIEAAKKLRNKPALLAGILLNKSEVLIKLGDLRGARSSLLKAYKLKILDVKERKSIEDNLRVVAAMCQAEDKLLTADDTDYKTLKTLYEKMGDGCCELKQFDKAIDYYKKMLDAAEKAGTFDLGPCYYSLAETYKDNGQFKDAVAYFERELKTCASLKDKLNSLSKIADTRETADDPVVDIQAVYNTAIKLCQDEGNRHEEGRMVKRCILFLRRQNQHSEAFHLEQILAQLDFNSSDSESEVSETPEGSVIGADVNLDALTDVSDDSECEQTMSKPRRRINFQIKRNVKGETQLHTACIKGQLNVVSHLLEQGHPVNVRDNCGWLPLHEACIYGHLDIVKLLIERGGAINDRGGTHCGGITPLHDAASNGHLRVVQLLLDKGATAVVKTDEGETALEFLQKWRQTAQLDAEDQSVYESIFEHISQALEKVGHVVVKTEFQPSQNTPQKSPVKGLRRSALIGLEEESSTSSQEGHVGSYKDVIGSLRRRSDPQSSKMVTKRPALLASEEMVDDWLEDDIGKSHKKRKTMSPSKKFSSPLSVSNSPTIKSSHSPSESVNMIDSLEDYQLDESENQYYCPPCVSNSPRPRKKRAKQTKLTSFGHSRTIVEADSSCSPSTSTRRESVPNMLKKTNSFEIVDPTLSVDVRIDAKLYRVPVLLSQVSTKTIKWLADQAAARYAKKEYTIPTLELETKNGAVLADDDLVSLLFPMGSTQAEELEARIIKWNVPPLLDRYKEGCQDVSTIPDEAVCQILQEFSVTLDLSNRCLRAKSLEPLCKVLSRQTNLLELDLSGNFLTIECIQLLGASLTSLINLYKVNFNCTNLKAEHVQTLVDSLSPDLSCKVTHLDLSDNFLEDKCFKNLGLLTRRFKLKNLNLSGNKFTRNVFVQPFNTDVTLQLDAVEEFDISDNDLDNEALIKILSWLSSCKLKSLNIARNSVCDGLLSDLLVMWNTLEKLEVCNLSRCHVRDCDLFDLISVASSLRVLIVSYNDGLTSHSLRKLLETTTISDVALYGCKNMFNQFVDLPKYLDALHGDSISRTVKLSVPDDRSWEVEHLIQLWKEIYGNEAKIEHTSKFLCLSSK